MAKTVVELKDVSIFQRKNLILHDINLTIERGEFVYLIGKTGSGKSSLLKILYGDLPLKKGTGMAVDFNLATLKESEIPYLRRKIGVVFQDFKLLPKRTVYENIAFALEISGMSNREIKGAVPKVIDIVGLTGKENKFPNQLSGGEKQRVAIARAIVRQPKILIADEPTGNLDPTNTWGIVRLLEKINRYGTTVLLTTHNTEIVNRLKRRVLTIENGSIVSDQSEGSYK